MHTLDDLTTWARLHLLAARTTRRLCPTFQPMLALRHAEADTVVVLANVPKPQMATVIGDLVRTARPDAVAVLVDAWVGQPSRTPPPPGVRVRDLPGRTDALVVVAMLASGPKVMWFLRYEEDAQHRVTRMGEPERFGADGSEIVTRLLPAPWGPREAAGG